MKKLIHYTKWERLLIYYGVLARIEEMKEKEIFCFICNELITELGLESDNLGALQKKLLLETFPEIFKQAHKRTMPYYSSCWFVYDNWDARIDILQCAIENILNDEK